MNRMRRARVIDNAIFVGYMLLTLVGLLVMLRWFTDFGLEPPVWLGQPYILILALLVLADGLHRMYFPEEIAQLQHERADGAPLPLRFLARWRKTESPRSIARQGKLAAISGGLVAMMFALLIVLEVFFPRR